MKTYKSSALTHQRAQVLKEARDNGVVIQECNTNGEVRCEYFIVGIVNKSVTIGNSTLHLDKVFSGDL